MDDQDNAHGIENRHFYDCRFDAILEPYTRRDQNEVWLETTHRDSYSNLGLASNALRARRDNQGSFRACRCGATVQPYFAVPSNPAPPRPMPLPVVPPDVWMCMGCEGVIHTPPGVFLPPGPYPL